LKEQIEIQNLIRSNLDQIKIKNPGFSLRAYAKKLELSPSALSEILNGKRKISGKMAARIIERMNLSPDISTPVLNLFDSKTKELSFEEEPGIDSPAPPPVIDFLQLSSDQFNLIAEWQHFALLSLMETKNFKSDIQWIARKLGISTQQAQTSLDRLIRLGFVFKKNRKFVTNKRALISSDNIPNQAVRKSHYNDLQLAEKALDHTPVDERDFTAITIAANKKNLPKARKMIREFQDKLTLCLEQGEKDEVIKFSFYLYPLTQEVESKD
jgi:uncharacterized protein (TIGR02147 family)